VINDPTPRAPDHPLIAVGKPVTAAAAVSTDIIAAAA